LIDEKNELRNSDLIKSNDELKDLIKIDPPRQEIPSFSVNKDFYAMSEMIQKLQSNNIKVVLFSTPHSKLYFDSIPNASLENFNLILDKLRQSNNIEIYYLHDKYTNLNIWRDNEHVAKNVQSL